MQTLALWYALLLPNLPLFPSQEMFEMPKKLKHPSHKRHALILLTKPSYAEGRYKCDACGEIGRGFCYQCKSCGIDLHLLCAAMPLSVTHVCHTHELNLTFGSPYATRKFCCGICKGPGSGHWLYKCNLCGFDAHMSCARGISAVRPLLGKQNDKNSVDFQSHVPTSQPEAMCSSWAATPRPDQGFGPQSVAGMAPPGQQNVMSHPMMNNNNVPFGIPAGGSILAPVGVNGPNNDLVIQAIQQMVSNNHAMAQAILAGGVGGSYNGGLGAAGGGYGGDRGSQQLMQLISGLSNMGIDGGVGEGQNFLQSLLGGENGVDVFGGGVLDFLGGALGGFSL
ncbi:hypothetical protein DH2020_002697 [Rehmannia glutinosa]|uniref:DC1 domain-containing protein n=1 Tax=Rehmannia glutinosa TaxID=99300 RepID=A0ABR0XUY5_REHGL